jgi:WD40 repeat protein
VKSKNVLMATAWLNVGLLVGCAEKPATQQSELRKPEKAKPQRTAAAGGPERTETPAKGSVPLIKSVTLKERFSLDTGVKREDKTPVGPTGTAISSDGKLALVMATEFAGNVQVWDLDKKAKMFQYDNRIGTALPVAISPNGKIGAYAAWHPAGIAVVDLATGKPIKRLQKKGDIPLGGLMVGLTFSPSGNLLVVASEKDIIGWDTNTWAERFDWEEKSDIAALSTFFDAGKKIASATEKGAVKVWDVAAGKSIHEFEAGFKDDKVKSLFVSSDGKQLGVGAKYSPFRILDATNGKLLREFAGDTGVHGSVRFLPDDRTVVYNGDWNIVIQDTVTGEVKKFAEGREARQSPVALTPDGHTLLSGHGDGKIRIWDLNW